ncbi:MAG TPA: YbaB/EbfC family nucleoid-associated protein [Pseudonocardiaceae bacterium]
MSAVDPVAQAYERSAAAGRARRRMAEVRGTGASDGGLVTAVVSGTGELLDLRISPEAMTLGPAGLGAAITAAARFAADDARQRGYTLLALALGDEAAAAVEALDGPAPARALGWDTVSERREPVAPEADRPPGLDLGTGTPVGRAVTGRTPDGGDADGDADEDDVFAFDPSIFRSDR